MLTFPVLGALLLAGEPTPVASGTPFVPAVVTMVRATPAAGSPEVCALLPGTPWTRWDAPLSTWRVGNGGGCQGFVNPPPPAPAAGPAPTAAYVLAHALNARRSPAQDAASRCWMRAGTPVRLAVLQQPWVYAQADHCAGWVHQTFVAPEPQTTAALAAALSTAASDGANAEACNLLERLVMREPEDEDLLARAAAGCARVDARRGPALQAQRDAWLWDGCRAPGEVWCGGQHLPGRMVLGRVVEAAVSSDALAQLETVPWLVRPLRQAGREALVALARAVMTSVHLPTVLAELEDLAAFVAYARGDSAWLGEPLGILLEALDTVDYRWAVGPNTVQDPGAPTPPETPECGFEDGRENKAACAAQYAAYLKSFARHVENVTAYSYVQGPVFVDRRIQLRGFHPGDPDAVAIHHNPKASIPEERVTALLPRELRARDPAAFRTAQVWTAAKALHRRGELAGNLVAAWAVNVLQLFPDQRWAQSLLSRHKARITARYNRFARAFNAGNNPVNPYANPAPEFRVVEQLDPAAFRAVRPTLPLMR